MVAHAESVTEEASPATAPMAAVTRGPIAASSASGQPRQAMISVLLGRLMNAAFAAGLPFEVLHLVGDVSVGPLAAVTQRTVQQVAGWAPTKG